jgi:cobalt-zinc-cadmium efflux system outer membrane protein
MASALKCALRCVALLLIVAAVLPVNAAGEPLSESRAIELGLSRVDVVNWLEGQLAAAEAETRATGHWSNPEIEYSRESVDLPGGENRETSYLVRQRFNIAGQLGLERDAARQQQYADAAGIEWAKRQLTAEIRRAFYLAVNAEQHAELLQRETKRLAKLNDTLLQRVLAGGVSRYDSLRLKREAALLRGQAATARAQADAFHEQLKSLIGEMPDDLIGNLMPPPIQPVAELEKQLMHHPRIQRLALETEAQRLTAKAATRSAWPELTVGVGQREVSSPGISGDGSTFEVGIEIPLFNRDRAERDRAGGRMISLQAEQNLLQQSLLAELRGTVKLLEARRTAAADLNEINGDSHSLIAIAEQSYWSGEMQVMELLDAHRTELNAQAEGMALQLAARMAYIELQTLTGE